MVEIMKGVVEGGGKDSNGMEKVRMDMDMNFKGGGRERERGRYGGVG